MNRPWQIWLAFAICLTVVLAAMGWVSLTALTLDRAQTDARRQAKLEENVRLALWRMDSTVSPLIARESARPYFTYTAFYPAGRAYTRMFEEIREGEVLLPSPLLTEPPSSVLLHFQLDSDGKLTSPQVPTGNMRDLAETRYTTREKIEAASTRLVRLQELVSTRELLTTLVLDSAYFTVPQPAPQVTDDQQLTSKVVQQLRSNVEYVARHQYQQEAQSKARDEVSNVVQLLTTAIEGDVMRPVWVLDTLLLARKVTVEKSSYIQGCWLDWPVMRVSLLEGVKDLLPGAGLEPVRASGGPQAAERLLAALPVRLVPGDVPSERGGAVSPVVLSLVIAWACVVLAAGAVALVLSGAVSLSERRGAFVSAVTHELRTPLTTFRMYTEMLEEGMVTDEQRRKEYLGTLRTEAERLGHLVENVLAYARLERGSGRGRIEPVGLADLVARSRDVLSARATQAGMKLVVEMAQEDVSRQVGTDAGAVEQILFNLVDNASKYAAASADKRIHLKVATSGGTARLSVCDHGPGIAPGESRRLFRPFRKSARDAANSAPGVGLGLALSRRLARRMHGDLSLDTNTPEGACFVLTLPLA